MQSQAQGMFPKDPANTYLDETSQELKDHASTDEHDEDVRSCQNAPNQIVVYDPETSDTGQALCVHPAEHEPLPKYAVSNQYTKILPSIGAFTVQCAECLKWRLIPTKEKYEEIREYIKEEPFMCATAREWRPNISCDDPTDISQDGSRVWAIDKPSIAQPPTGWERLVRLRSEGGTRFADVYYITPTGKTLRSTVEVENYLLEHPEFIRAGVTLSQFSFQIPKPLQKDYVKRRSYKKARQQDDAIALEMLIPHEPAEVSPLSWAGPTQSTDLPIVTRPDGSSAPCFEAPPVSDPVVPPPKKKRARPSKKYTKKLRDEPKVKEKPQQAWDGANEL
ncbi:hypothetical protein MRB53_013084 [Persea americana]|uniref:Uncharacterized protein n=1 Tax=Persea americana TaxID=3435 RepID=A0ACC2K708_PERAE|nr:hypothetical protein MRB53_013084 [Persea americana]